MSTPQRSHIHQKTPPTYEILSNEVFATAIISNNKHRQNINKSIGENWFYYRKKGVFVYNSFTEFEWICCQKEVVKKSTPPSLIIKYIFYNFIVMDYHMMIIYVCILNRLNIINTTTNNQTDENWTNEWTNETMSHHIEQIDRDSLIGYKVWKILLTRRTLRKI